MPAKVLKKREAVGFFAGDYTLKIKQYKLSWVHITLYISPRFYPIHLAMYLIPHFFERVVEIASIEHQA